MAASVPNKFVGTTTQDVSSLDANFDALVNFLNSGVDFQGAELVASYAAIRALTASTTSTTLAFTTGRLSMGDGGMGWFRADASDTTSADNDATILVAADGMRWKRLFSGAVNVVWFGAVGDNNPASATINSTAFENALEFIISQRTPVGANSITGDSLFVPRGVYYVNPNVFGSFTETDVRGITVRGEGYQNSLLVLAADGAFGTYSVSEKILFVVFYDLAFCGDTLLNTDPEDATNPVTDARSAFVSYVTGGVQNFTFYNCLFARFGKTIIWAGSNNESENRWYGCKFWRCRDILVQANQQSLNNTFFAPDLYLFSGSILSQPAVNPEGGTDLGGGSNRIWGGNIIAVNNSGVQRYLVDLNAHNPSDNDPILLVIGARFELDSDNIGIYRITVPNQNVNFTDCGFWFSQQTSPSTEILGVHAFNSNVRFIRSGFLITETGVTQEWQLTTVAAELNESGVLLFDGCRNSPAPEQIVFSGTDNFSARAIVRNAVSNNGATRDENLLNYTLTCPTGGRLRFSGLSPSTLPGRNTADLLSLGQAPYWDSTNSVTQYESTIVLPPNCILARIYLFIPPGGSSSADAIYTIVNGNGVTFGSLENNPESGGGVLDVTGAQLLGNQWVDDTTNMRTLTLSTTTGVQPHMAFGFVEYF